MIIRNFTADSAEEAYADARRALGPDAIILSTNVKRSGNWITRWFRSPEVEVVAGRPRPRLESFAVPPARPGAAAGAGSSVDLGVPRRRSHPGSVSDVRPLDPANTGGPLPEVNPYAAAAAPTPVPAAPVAPVAGAVTAPPPAPAEVPAPLADSVRELERKVGELAELKGLIEKVIARSSEVEPARVEPQALDALARMPAPARIPAAFEGLLMGLKKANLDSSIRAMIKDGVKKALSEDELSDPEAVYQAAVDTLSGMLKIGEGLGRPRKGEAPQTVVLVGPTGVGKTTTLAKLAARFQFEGEKKVALITVDTYRIGAPEQLKQYADIIGIPLKVVFKPEDLAHAMQAFSDKDVVLVDTVGRSHRNEDDIADLERYMAALPGAEVHLVVSATTKYEDLREQARAFRPLGVKGVMVTKLDETASYGEVVSLLVRDRLPIHFVTTGQGVPDDIRPADSSAVARLVVPTPPERKRRSKAEAGRDRDAAGGGDGEGPSAPPKPARQAA